MPKLPKNVAKRVADAESSSFDALPAGIYVGRLDEVSVETGKQSGQPYWRWTFKDITDADGEKHPGSLWVNTSLSEKADFKMKEVFEAFGYSTDSDTDELVGDRIRLLVEVVTIEQGARKGQPGNNVVRCLTLEADGDDEDEAKSDDDLFD